MKKFLVLIALLISTSAIVSAAAVQPPQPPEKRGTITIYATAEKDLTPDTAELSIVIETYDSKSMQKASAANKEISDKIYGALKTMINPANGDYIKTSNFNAAPEYKYSNNKSVLSRYRVNNNVIIKTKSIDKIGAMIDKSIALGATSVGSLNFSVSNYDAEFETLLTEASKKAYAQANAVLKPAYSNITGVNSINVNFSGQRSRAPQYMMMAEKSMSMADSNEMAEPSYTVIEPGTIKLNASINAVYFVK